MMKEIEITEENYKMYQKFYDIKNNISELRHPFLCSVGITAGLFACLCGIAPYGIIIKNIVMAIGMSLYEPLSIIGILGSYGIIISILIGKGIPSFFQHMRMGDFLKIYPNFDINTDVNEVEKALEKYRKLSKMPKNIEEKKKDHLTNLPDKVKEMSTDEKLVYLEQEREFWEQVKVQEKYQDLEEQKEKSMQKSLS